MRDAFGLLSQYAMSYGSQLIQAANSKKRMSRDTRKAVREHGARLIEFARRPIVKGRQHPPTGCKGGDARGAKTCLAQDHAMMLHCCCISSDALP